MAAARIYRRLRELLDVTVSNPSDGQVLAYDAATSKWRNEAAATGGDSSVLAQPFSLTAAQLKASMLTPVTIIPAQGAGTFVVPIMYVVKFIANTTPYNGPAVDLVWGDDDLDLNVLFSGIDAGVDFALWTSGTNSFGYSEGGAFADYLNNPLKFAANLRGVVASVAVFNPGNGYAVGDTGTIDDGSPLATYTVASVSGGNVTAVTVTGGGGDYSLGVGRTPAEWTTTPAGAQPGAGSGMTVQITAIDASGTPGDGTLSGTVYYLVTDLS